MYQIYKITCPTGETYYGQHHGDIFEDDYWGSGSLIWEYYNNHLEYSDSDYKREVLVSVNTLEECNEQETKAILFGMQNDKACLNITTCGYYRNVKDMHWYHNVNTGELKLFHESYNIPPNWEEGMGSTGTYMHNDERHCECRLHNCKCDSCKDGPLPGNRPTWGDNAKGKCCYNNGKEGDELEQGLFNPGTEPDGWIRGNKRHSISMTGCESAIKGKGLATNGVDIAFFSDESEFPDATWRWGGVWNEGTKWYNNGIEQNMYIPGQEPEGYVLGQLPDPDKNDWTCDTVWCYNPETKKHKRVPENQIPEGYIKGRFVTWRSPDGTFTNK